MHPSLCGFGSKLSGITAIVLMLTACSGQNTPTCDDALVKDSVEAMFLDTLRRSPFYFEEGLTGVEGLTEQHRRKFQEQMTMASQQKLGWDPNSKVKQHVRITLADIQTHPGKREDEHACAATLTIRPANDPEQALHTFPARYDIQLRDDTYVVELESSDDILMGHRMLQMAWLALKAKSLRAKPTAPAPQTPTDTGQ